MCQHRKLAKNAPIGGPQLARIRDFRVFRDLGAHEAELGPPTDFSRAHRRTRDPHHSTDQSLYFLKKILRAKSDNRIARKIELFGQKVPFCPAGSFGRFAPVTVLLLEHGGILGR